MSTAVILAARQERDSDVPYPLMPFEEGKCLIDRTLEILRGSGYRKILIVAGFRFDMFKRFSENGVTVVPAPDYRHTASMASLATVRNLVDEDFLLIEGDTFYERKVVEKLTASSHRNCLATTEESGSGDEAFTESSQGFITKVSKDRHQICQFEGELLGICKISHDTYQKMLLRWDEGNNPLVNYEYLLMDCTSVLERPFIHFKNLIWGDVDNRSNYERLVNYTYPRLRRKEDPFDRENLLNHLRDIFGSRLRDDEVAVEQIGGMSNKNFKVRLNGESYVLRVPGIASEGMVDRSVEGRNSQFASRIGINPEVRYFNDRTGVKLTDYICGAETLNGATIQRKDNLQKIAAIYRTLHMSKVRFNNDFNVFREIGKYESLLQQCGAVMYSGYDTVRDELPLLEARLNELGVSLAPCHNDAVAENFIKDADGRIFLIDWEYSGMNDPLWDFAALFLESDFMEDSRELFLNSYYDGEIPPETREKILIYQILMDVLWSLWTVIKESGGDNFGTYGPDRFSRALENIQRWNETHKRQTNIKKNNTD